jgi:hypothetical protein
VSRVSACAGLLTATLAFCAPARAAEGVPASELRSGEVVSAAELRAELSGNTLSGYNTSGVVFSEYHAPDGRILGHNNGEPVVEGCWDIRDNGVCYYYARSRRPGTYCWRYGRAGSDGYRLQSFDHAVTGLARLDPGNPRGHSDGGHPWTCEGLVSHLLDAAAPVARASARGFVAPLARRGSGS